jgi:hypothetical protein
VSYFTGVDVHKSYLCLVVKDEQGKLVHRGMVPSRKDNQVGWARPTNFVAPVLPIAGIIRETTHARLPLLSVLTPGDRHTRSAYDSPSVVDVVWFLRTGDGGLWPPYLC